MTTSTRARIEHECDRVRDMLIAKNITYGDSATNPVRIFSRCSAEEQLLVRIDDKLSRIQRGYEYGDDDSILDLIGYLILLRVVRSSDE